MTGSAPPGPGDRLGHYRLEALIGQGGMGQVFRATDLRRERLVALKLLAAHLASDDAFRNRFMRESRIAARLSDPHVIPIHDWGEIDGHLFLDMRLVNGRDLREVLAESGPMTPDRALGIVGQVAAALDAAHADGLVHRDVKPDNVLLDAHDFAYLVDFGLAQTDNDTRLTADGQAIGSFGYMAPERFGDEPAGAPADIYALTCVLYECLTGTTPFGPTRSLGQLVAAHLNSPPPQLGSPMDPVIARGMAKDPAQRFSSARDLVQAARSALGAGPAGATTLPPPAFGQPQQSPAPPAESVPTLVGSTPARGASPGGPPPPPSSPSWSGGPAHPSGPYSPAPKRDRLIPIALGVVVVLLLAAVGVGGWLLLRDNSRDDSAASNTGSASDTSAPPRAATGGETGRTATETTTVTPPGAGPTATALPAPRRGAADLGLAVPMSRPACDGTGIVVVGNAVTPGAYPQDVQTALDRFPGSSYLRTDESCPSLRPRDDNGNVIYAVYQVAGRSTDDVCALRERLLGVAAAYGMTGGDAPYGKWLDTTTANSFIIPC